MLGLLLLINHVPCCHRSPVCRRPVHSVQHAIEDFQKTQERDWKPKLPDSKKLFVLLLALPAVSFIACVTTLWFMTPYSFSGLPFSPLDLIERLPGAMAVIVGLYVLWSSVLGNSGGKQMCLSDPLAFSGCSVKDCPAFQKNKHPPVEAEKPEDMRKLLDSMGVPAPVLLAAGTGTVQKRGVIHGAVVSNLDKYWSTMLILALIDSSVVESRVPEASLQ